MSLVAKRHVERSPLLTAFFLCLILIATVTLPYLFPAPISISRSYVAGFSNRAAVLILIVGTGILGVWTRGRMARWQAMDSRLGVGWLAVALAITLAQCLKITATLSRLPGTEALYFFNRLQLLLAGKAPYKDFEFVYGPLLLYPPVWMQSLTHTSLLKSYSFVWLGYWLLGVVLIWLIVRWVDVPTPRRPIIFLLLVASQLAWAGFGGLSYTPARAYLAAGCIVLSHRVGRRTGNLWLATCTALASLLLAIGVSMEQAVGATLGLFAVLILLTLSSITSMRWLPLAVFVAGAVICFAWADHAALTLPLKAFGGGGYAYPLLPSFPILAVLFAYIAGGLAFCRAIFAYVGKEKGKLPEPIDVELRGSAVLPLAIAGCSMVPNALGRCDVLHVTAAMPLFVVGVIAVFGMPSLRRWFLAALVVGLLIFPLMWHRILTRLPQPAQAPDPKLLAQGYLETINDNQLYESLSQPKSSALPCDRQYFSPSLMPEVMTAFRPECLDTGYYLGLADVITPTVIDMKVNELKQRPTMPLLMEDTPLEAQLPLQLARMQSLYGESETFWVPPARHPPLTYAKIIDYIREHYVPGPSPSKGLRIWYPKTTAAAGS